MWINSFYNNNNNNRKLLVQDSPMLEDLEAVDFSIVNSLRQIVESDKLTEENFNSVIFNTFTTTTSNLMEIELFPGGDQKEVTYQNRKEYYELVIQYRLHEFDKQAVAVRSGLATIVPIDLLVRSFFFHLRKSLL
jgi:cystathionine beta-lyase/cystathionine gamma-synthase